MASAPSDPRLVRGRIDRDGRLVSADPELADLQVDAGSQLGARLALPQIAAIARLARSLGIPVSRPAVAGGKTQDFDLLVRAEPKGEEIELAIEGWTARPAGSPRLAAQGGESVGGTHSRALLEWSADAELRLTSISPELAQLLGIGAAEAAGQSLMRLFRLEEAEDGDMPLVAAVASRQGFSGQPARPRSGDGATRLVLSAEAVHGPDGGFAGFEGQALAPDQVQPTDGADRLDEALDEALRTPLDRIIACAEQIAASKDGSIKADYLDYANDISAAAKHLLSVVESMTEEPAPESESESESIDLAALAAEAVVMLESSAEERGIAFILESTRSLRAKGEERAVIQVLVNLISNAVRHSADGGTITIRFRRGQAEACVSVQDEGPGIDPVDQQRIFERFERASSGKPGTGLGLAISRRLARSMGGEIELESAPGKGARFTLKLPRA